MKMEITQKRENALLKRTEVRFTIDHRGEATPARGAVVDEIARQTKASRDVVVLNNIDTVYGGGMSKGYAKVYASRDAAFEFESDYILKRNGIAKPEYVKPAAEGAPAE